jgi:transcriptional regulator with XRE-family HTH domain
MALSRGAQALTRKIVSTNDIAERVGVTRQTVWLWKTGAVTPEPEHMKTLEDECGIPMRDWLEPGEPDRRIRLRHGTIGGGGSAR